jgi:hypothetical protein
MEIPARIGSCDPVPLRVFQPDTGVTYGLAPSLSQRALPGGILWLSNQNAPGTDNPEDGNDLVHAQHGISLAFYRSEAMKRDDTD